MIPRTTTRRPAAGLLALALLSSVAAPAARGGLLNERLSREPFALAFGTGQARLDGMGLSIAAPDENNEINLLDFGANPAGLLADRDSWSVDARYDHRERLDRDPAYRGNEFIGDTWSFLAAFRNTGTRAVGLGVDYLDGRLGTALGSSFKYKQTQYRLLYNQMFGRLSAGGEFRYLAEKEDQTGGDSFYNIEHTSSSVMGLIGLSYEVHPWVGVAARGALERTNISGRASADAYDDSFDWQRPAGSLEGQAFVNHPRIKGGLTFGRTQGAGEETIDAAWSPLFIFNPGTRFVEFQATTFTEDNEINQLRTRWEYDIIPGRARLAGSFSNSSRNYSATTNPIVIGSRPERQLTDDQDQLGLGGSVTLLNDRLLIGGEFARVGSTFADLHPLTGFKEETTLSQFGVGGEYIAADNLALRGGLAVRSIDRNDTVTDTPDPTYRARRPGSASEQLVSVGVGWVPRGGALQLDAAYTTGIGSDFELQQNHASFYARVLF